MPKYVINTVGNIINKNNEQVDFNRITKELNELKIPIDGDLDKPVKTNKFFEMNSGGGLVVTNNLLDNANGDITKYPLNSVVNSTKKLNNSSFGFFSEDVEKRETTYYNSYNSVFDLDLDNFNSDNFANTQIFAENVDFYGFPLIATNPVELIADELPVKLFTLIDTILASTIPIATITTLQVLLQNSSFSNVNIGDQNITDRSLQYELGSYIRYEKSTSGLDIFYDVAKITLNSFERLMNYPRFKMPTVDPGLDFFEKAKETLLNILKFIGLNILYFIEGYIFYLNPGLKSNVSLENIDFASISELIATFITTNSSRHIYNLLLRKIIRSNYFLNKVVNNDAKKTTGNFETNLNSTLIFLSGFFFRFVGERVAIGENLIKTNEKLNSNRSKSFFESRENQLTAKVRDSDETTYLRRKPSLSFMNLVSNDIKDYETIKEYKNKFIENKKELKSSEIYRISKKSLDEIERIIEKDYIPFSLHDLRTNEVLKFHAFIDSISDSYTANYNEMGGFGRLEKIKTYANTTRSINVSFKLAAMSYEDHSEMWYAINKIVSMLYPQWSRGVNAREFLTKEIKKDLKKNIEQKNQGSTANNAINLLNSIKELYKVPFSQIPSNAPMIRLRIGDLITSNYSKFQAAKLFGFEPKIYSKSVSVAGKVDVAEIKKAIENLIKQYYIENISNIPKKYKDDGVQNAQDLAVNLVIAANKDKLFTISFKDDRNIKKKYLEFSTAETGLTVNFSKDTTDHYKYKVTITSNSLIDSSYVSFNVIFQKDPFKIQSGQAAAKTTRTVKAIYFVKDDNGQQEFVKENQTIDLNDFQQNIFKDPKIAADVNASEGREVIKNNNGDFVLKQLSAGDIQIDVSGQINVARIISSVTSKDNKNATYNILKYELKDVSIEVESQTEVGERYVTPSISDISNFENNKKIVYSSLQNLLSAAAGVQSENQKAKASQVTELQDKLDLQEKFLKAEDDGTKKINNPIIKAFESNMGKGLAGFITSFNIDWEQGSFWEISPGNRAPKIVTITLGFSPSHDIPLGLDHRGNLRSIAYAVGSGASINRGLYMQENNFNYDDNQFKDKEK
jgi:hypothetical protein